jgi:hypothetical protein
MTEKTTPTQRRHTVSCKGVLLCSVTNWDWNRGSSALFRYILRLEPREFCSVPLHTETGTERVLLCSVTNWDWNRESSALFRYILRLEPREICSVPLRTETGTERVLLFRYILRLEPREFCSVPLRTETGTEGVLLCSVTNWDWNRGSSVLFRYVLRLEPGGVLLCSVTYWDWKQQNVVMVLRGSDQWVTALQTAGLSSRQRGRSAWRRKKVIVEQRKIKSGDELTDWPSVAI